MELMSESAGRLEADFAAPHRPWISRDVRLARLAARGDERAFSAIYRKYHQELYRYCRAILHDPYEAEDALQQAMVRALRSLPGETREIALRPWLYRVAHNEAISILRARRPVAQIDLEQVELGADVEGQAAARERLRQLFADIQQLPERQRGALLMRELSGLSFDDIGAAFGLRPAAARQAVYEARLSLHEMTEGREMECEAVRQSISAQDRRLLRQPPDPFPPPHVRKLPRLRCGHRRPSAGRRNLGSSACWARCAGVAARCAGNCQRGCCRRRRRSYSRRWHRGGRVGRHDRGEVGGGRTRRLGAGGWCRRGRRPDRSWRLPAGQSRRLGACRDARRAAESHFRHGDRALGGGWFVDVREPRCPSFRRRSRARRTRRCRRASGPERRRPRPPRHAAGPDEAGPGTGGAGTRAVALQRRWPIRRTLERGWPIGDAFERGWPIRRTLQRGWPIRRTLQRGWPIRGSFECRRPVGDSLQFGRQAGLERLVGRPCRGTRGWGARVRQR